MAYKIKSDLNTAGNIVVQGKTTGLSISTEQGSEFSPDADGSVDLPVNTRPEIDYIFNQFPLSQYGAVNSNKIGVSGTFDGGSTVSNYSASPVLMEGDGSLVYLRPGTNGSTINYYYTYINNPDSFTTPFTTNNKYYTGTWNNVLFYDTDAKTNLIYEEVGNNKLYFVLTNGTMDKTKHVSASTTRDKIPHYILNSMVMGGYIFIITLYSSTYNYAQNPAGVNFNQNDPFQFILYRVKVSDVQAGVISAVEQISALSGAGFDGNFQGPQPYIRIANAWVSDIGLDTVSFIKKPSGISTCQGFSYSVIGSTKSAFDGTNWVFSFYSNMFCADSKNRVDSSFAVTVTLNMLNRTFTTDLNEMLPIDIQYTDSDEIIINNPYEVTSDNLYGTGNYTGDGEHGSSYTTALGVQYYIKEKRTDSDYQTVYRSKIKNFTGLTSAIQIRNRRFSTAKSHNVYSSFASRVGDQLAGGIPVSDTKIMFSGTGSYSGNSYSRYDKAVADIGSTRNYTYQSLSSGSVNGYAPQSSRLPVTDVYSGISYCDTTGTVTYYGTTFIEDEKLVSGYKLNAATLSYDTTVTVDNSVLTAFKNSVLGSLNIVSPESRIALYYSPDSTFLGSIMCITAVNSTGGGNVITAVVNVQVQSGAITQITLQGAVNNYYHAGMTALLNTPDNTRHSGMSVVKYSDFTYVSFSHPVGFVTPGGVVQYSYTGYRSGNDITSLTRSESSHIPDSSVTAKEYSYIPKYGFGYYTFTGTDKGSKLIFRKFGTSLSEFTAMIAGTGTGTDTVIIAQDVKEDFNVYFTEITPAFIAGQYYEVPAGVVQLDSVTATPGNKTFYMYVQLIVGRPVYTVSLSEIPESNTSIFIGTVSTDGTKVSVLNINKVSRFDTYRPSVTKIGSAFPVSTGDPSGSGSIQW